MNAAIAEEVRRHDPDRFLTALFAPPPKRAALLTLYAFNHELARARDVASEPTLALIRLQWWREVVEGAVRRHPVADVLRDTISTGALAMADLLAMIDAREAEAEPGFATTADWQAYLYGSAGGVAVAAGHLLGAPDAEALRPLGAAYGLAGVLRSILAHARQGRCLLPHDRLAEHALTPERLIATPSSPQALMVTRQLAREGMQLLRRMRLPRSAIAAALPAVLARRDLRRAPAFPVERGLGDRVGVLLAAISSRV
ncbi:MAG TPA: squalene/phytoene synthase family protein [Acetobacteraceae bacterium]|nr:squalene/phytoene synthase family protein [Acetobacteraceae bacterium]